MGSGTEGPRRNGGRKARNDTGRMYLQRPPEFTMRDATTIAACCLYFS